MITSSSKSIPVNWQRLLESQLLTWQGGSQHPKGISEYISNSDDSYRRLKKFEGEQINVYIYSRRGKMIDKLIIEDFAEGMSFRDLEDKFFQYFDSHSGRESGEKVTGKFGTGGKAYAIMNFRHCWIQSRKDRKECKAWFKWDNYQKSILYGYDNGGYINKATNECNGTTIFLENSLQVKSNLEELGTLVEKSARIRHVLKNQNIKYTIIRRTGKAELTLSYQEPKDEDAIRIWNFILPVTLSDNNDTGDILKLKYYEQPLPDEKNIIDISDGLSSVADYKLKEFDARSYAKHLFGSIIINRLYDSPAVKENRKGLEEGNDLTNEIEEFISEKIKIIVDDLEQGQKEKEKVNRQEEANKKLNELSKFLNKQNLNFKLQISELKKKYINSENHNHHIDEDKEDDLNDRLVFRPAIPEDPIDSIISGTWVTKTGGHPSGGNGGRIFIPNTNGEDNAVNVNSKLNRTIQKKEERRGIQVLMSNDENNPDSPILSEYEEPVIDKDIETKGIIWINSIHPIIKATSNTKSKTAFLEAVSNFVLVVIAQYFAQKELELQPESELDEPLMIFRKHYFKLQKEIRVDSSINFFEEQSNVT